MALHGSTVLPIGSILATIELLELSPAASVLGLWWEAVAESFRVVRDRSGAVVGVSIVIKGDRVPARPAQGDPLVGRWGDHLKRNPLATARGVLFHRHGWTGSTGRPPPDSVAAGIVADHKGRKLVRQLVGRCSMRSYSNSRTPDECLKRVMGRPSF